MDEYFKDDGGRWWYRNARQQGRAKEQICKQCGKGFVNRHPQQFCSAICRSASQKGVPRIDRAPITCPECGKVFQPAPSRNPRYGARYCTRECGYRAGNKTRGRAGALSAKWKGGVKNHKSGYVLRYAGTERKMLLEHRLVMERVLGRRLLRSENVHHKNGIRDDNRPANLELWLKKQPPGQRVHEQKHCPTCTCCIA